MEVYIIRHGQSVNNALMEDQHLRVADPDLTPLGVQQAERVAKFLAEAPDLEQMVRHSIDSDERKAATRPQEITHLYCSPMRRALQTAQPIARALGLRVNVWVDIHEHGGIFLEEDGVVTGLGGMTRSQIAEEFPDYELPETITDAGWWGSASGMEDISGVYARAARVALDLRARAQSPKTRGDKVALVAHGMFIDALLKAFLNNLPSNRYFHWHYNTAVSRVDLIEDGVVLVRYVNRVDHLPPDLVT